MERREYTRLSTNLVSELVLPGGRRLNVVIRDLSFGGAYADYSEAAAVWLDDIHAKETLTLEMTLEDDSLPVAVRCNLIELCDARIGLRFAGAEAGDFERLRGFMLEKAADPEAMIREIQSFPNPVFSGQTGLPSFTKWLDRILGRLRNTG
ncbi:MAG: PilZ domain-containing protein [Gammaproteobacteria bacterium]|nr:PilZ domain-containing protein [Gammaproteobacteria bacterium]